MQLLAVAAPCSAQFLLPLLQMFCSQDSLACSEAPKCICQLSHTLLVYPLLPASALCCALPLQCLCTACSQQYDHQAKSCPLCRRAVDFVLPVYS